MQNPSRTLKYDPERILKRFYKLYWRFYGVKEENGSRKSKSISENPEKSFEYIQYPIFLFFWSLLT